VNMRLDCLRALQQRFEKSHWIGCTRYKAGLDRAYIAWVMDELRHSI